MADKESFWKTLATFAAAITAVAGSITAIKQCSKEDPSSKPVNEQVANANPVKDETGILNQQHISKDDIANNQHMMRQEIEQLKQQLAQKSEAEPVSSTTHAVANIGGLWRDMNTGASYTFVQAGNNFTFQEHSNLFGANYVSAAGQGAINGPNVSVTYTTLMNTTGSGTLLLSLDNRSMAGTLIDNVTGAQVNVNLIR